MLEHAAEPALKTQKLEQRGSLHVDAMNAGRDRNRAKRKFTVMRAETILEAVCIRQPGNRRGTYRKLT